MNIRTSNGASRECDRILRQLKDDHARVKKGYQRFQQLDPQRDREEVESIVRETVDALDVHAILEEECLYPQARDGLVGADLIDEAEIEHASMRRLIQQLQSMTAEGDKFAARFTVLCEYVLHHVKQEEGELFPELRKIELDWPTIGRHMDQRRHVLTANGALGPRPQVESRATTHPAPPLADHGVPGPAAYRVPAAKA